MEKIECTGDDAIFFACTSVETPRVPRVQGRVRADIKVIFKNSTEDDNKESATIDRSTILILIAFRVGAAADRWSISSNSGHLCHPRKSQGMGAWFRKKVHGETAASYRAR